MDRLRHPGTAPAGIVQLFMQRGINPARLAVIGLGQYRPAQENSSEQGRNANRRVVIVVLSGEGNEEGRDESRPYVKDGAVCV